MQLLKTLSMFLVMAILTATVVADSGSNVYNRFGKGPTTAGLTPGYGGSSGGGYYYRSYVQPAPVIATAPATGGRQAFSVAPSTAQSAAPAVAATPPTNERRSFSVAPSTTQPAAPPVRVMSTPRGSGQEYNRFGKGPTAIGLTPPGFSR
jgi:hypothetical protein